MKRFFAAPGLFGLLIGLLWLTLSPAQAAEQIVRLPYQQAGLNDRQAAAYLLDRLSFGARPGDVDRVVSMGVERWVRQQLQGGLPEQVLESKLTAFPALTMNHQQMAARYPGNSLVSAHARRFHDLIPPAGTPVDFDWVKRRLNKFRLDQGFVDDVLLTDELVGQKIVRAVYSENQLTEVLTDFWSNHFYTTTTSFRARPWVLAYERDAVRPNVFGKFHDLLIATARHPAMLQYLENAQSALPTNENSLMAFKVEQLRAKAGRHKDQAEQTISQADKELQEVEAEEQFILDKKFRPRTGVNENYARVLIELHTLGSDGGHTRQDIAEAARAFSGWTTMPIGASAEWFRSDLAHAQKLGFVRQGSFLFRADWHDAKEKRIFGKRYPAAGGVEEGEQILAALAANPATARHITRKLAVRFVSEQPPETLLKRLASTFSQSKGDLKLVMQALIESPEFWNAARERTKVKSPFVLAVSALRSVNADIAATKGMAEWIARMGQPLYGYQAAATGFPDRADFWITPGSLLHRMNFAVTLGAGGIDGVAIDPTVLVSRRQPDSPEEALAVYARELLPERDVSPIVSLLQPVVQSPRFSEAGGAVKAVAANTAAAASTPVMMAESADNAMMSSVKENAPAAATGSVKKSDPAMRIIGMIVGSPQFQVH